MINELKKQIKLLKYGFNLKSSIVTAVIFFLIGIFLSVYLMDSVSFLMGGLYVVLAPAMALQVKQSLLVSGLVASSPKKRSLETWMTDILQMVIGVTTYLLLVAFAVWEQNLSANGAGDYAKSLIYIGILEGILWVYYGIVYKSFWLSTIAFAITYFLAMTNGFADGWFSKLSVGMAGAPLLGLLFVFLGNFLSAVLRRALYRKPLTKYAMGINLRKYM